MSTCATSNIARRQPFGLAKPPALIMLGALGLLSLFFIIGHRDLSKKQRYDTRVVSRAMAVLDEETTERDCLVARKAGTSTHTIVFDPNTSTYLLPKPFINLGFPKVGSTTMHKFFECAGFKSSHNICDSHGFIKFKGNRCGVCFKNALKSDLPMLETCGNYDAWMQIDADGLFYPQIEYLEEIHNESPNATFVLPFRDVSTWHKSLQNWKMIDWPKHDHTTLEQLIVKADLPGLPPGVGHIEEELVEWWCWHVKIVREFVKIHPSHALVEVDIEDPLAGSMMGTLFGASQSCWGHANSIVEEKERLCRTKYPGKGRRKEKKDCMKNARRGERRADRRKKRSNEEEDAESNGK